eukprot:CAMPEP_0114257948 /NCGR_PEP_ID=MMETSP0058-20121206/19025_1 /TAXON_ID=36894 /ORGANISM="Pyramimonas parkeae, CCMP726" /LENGTH=473 /DNA_ID=CAMNT_0001372749 /DNA_START=621 /DNA_END=2039 /DNA_ORIENTATION=+
MKRVNVEKSRKMSIRPKMKETIFISCAGLNPMNNATSNSRTAAPSQKIRQLERVAMARKFQAPSHYSPPMNKNTNPKNKIADTLTIEDVQNRNALDLMARVQATNLPAIAEKFMPIETLKDSALGRWTALEAVHETGACSHAANSHFSSEGLRREVRLQSSAVARAGDSQDSHVLVMVVNDRDERPQSSERNPQTPSTSAAASATLRPGRWVPPHLRWSPNSRAPASAQLRSQEQMHESPQASKVQDTHAGEAVAVKSNHEQAPRSGNADTAVALTTAATPQVSASAPAPGRWVPPHMRSRTNASVAPESSPEAQRREEEEIQERNDRSLRESFVRTVQKQILEKQARYSAQYDGQRDVESWDLHEGKRDVTVCCAGPYAIARRQNLGTNGQGEIQWGARIWEPVHDIPRSAFKVRFQLEPQVRFFERASMAEIVGNYRSDEDPNYGFAGTERNSRLASFASRSLMSNTFKEW